MTHFIISLEALYIHHKYFFCIVQNLACSYKVAAVFICKCSGSQDWHTASCVVHCLRGKGGGEEANRQDEKQVSYWRATDFHFWRNDERAESGKRQLKPSEIHTSCFTSFPCPPSLWKASISSTRGLWWPQEATTWQGGAEGGWGPERKSHCAAFSLSQPCALASCAVWLFYSGEQVRWINWILD